jgi:uncharacterized protein (DUF427 family)
MAHIRHIAFAWYYPYPNYQYAPIQNLIAFPHEGVDEFYIDGQPLSTE